MTSRNAKIGVATATIIGMNAMIGSGIFTAPAAMASHVGPAGILAYIFVVIAVWFVALSLAQLARLFPQEGSFYTYAKQWGGHSVGVLASVFYLIGLMIAMGLLSQMAGEYLQTFIPQASQYTLGLICLIALVILNMVGVAFSQLGQHILIACTLFPLLATTVMCFSKANVKNLVPFAPYGFGNVLKATRIVIFSFFGFESAASLFNIVRDPQKNVPKALTYSILLVGAIYTLFVGSIILSTPLSLFSDARVPLTETLKNVFHDNQWIIMVINFSILSAILGTIHSMIWGSSHLLISIMNKLKSSAAKNLMNTGWINQKTSVFFIGICIFITFATFKNLGLFFNLTAIFIVSAFILSMITLLTIKEEWKSGQNIKTILGILTACAILIFAIEGFAQEIVKIL